MAGVAAGVKFAPAETVARAENVCGPDQVLSPSRNPRTVPLVPVGTPRFVRASEALVAPVPPLATTKVPSSVTEPEVVTGPPLVVRPVVPPSTSTLVTVPPLPVALTVIAPPPLVIVTPVPAVSVALSSVLPEELPMRS